VNIEVPRPYFVYEFSYPEKMPELAGVIFYVGKGVNLTRMDDHLREAAKGCMCAKCEAIRSICNVGLLVARRIVFESRSEGEVLNEEMRRIIQHRSPHLTNIVGNKDYVTEKIPPPSMRNRPSTYKTKKYPIVVDTTILQCKCECDMIMCSYCRQWYCVVCDWKIHLNQRCCYPSSEIQHVTPPSEIQHVTPQYWKFLD
jgi:hypothetical protein